MKLVYIAINKSVAILKREGFLGEKEKKNKKHKLVRALLVILSIF